MRCEMQDKMGGYQRFISYSFKINFFVSFFCLIALNIKTDQECLCFS